MNADHATQKNSQACGELTFCFKHLSKDNIIQPYRFQHEFRREGQLIVFVLDLGYQKHISKPPQINKTDPTFSDLAGQGVVAVTTCYPLIPRIKISKAEYRQRHFDLM